MLNLQLEAETGNINKHMIRLTLMDAYRPHGAQRWVTAQFISLRSHVQRVTVQTAAEFMQ